MAYDPTQFAIAKANVRGSTVQNIGNAVINSVDNINKIVQMKNANKKVQDAYLKTLYGFITEAQKVDPKLSRVDALIAGRKIYKRPVSEFDAETNLKNLVAGDIEADRYFERLQEGMKRRKVEGFKKEASTFTQQAQQPITEQRQIQAEGPFIPGAEGAAGEVPMEQQEFQRPMRQEEYQQGFNQLSPEARTLVPEGLREQTGAVEQTYQQPMKTFEAERDKMIKAKNETIKTMGNLDKGTGIHTAIIESQDTVEGLNTKKKSLDELVKLVTKANNLPPRQIQDKGNELQMEIDDIASQLNIPAQLSSNPEFLGRMQDDIDRLIAKEKQQQSVWDTELKDLRKRQEMEEQRKRTPRPPTTTPDWRLGKELQTAIKDMTKQQFPDLYKVVNGEYGVETMKKMSGVAEAARAIMRDPQKRIALAYAFPEEVGAIAQAKGAPRPPDAQIQAVLSEMQQLQNKVYGIIKSTPPKNDENLFGSVSGENADPNNPLSLQRRK
jgi:hypothetical protein